MGEHIPHDVDMAAPTNVEPEAEPAQDRTPSSIKSTPEAEEQQAQPSHEQPQQPPKSKGGRKPVCPVASQWSSYPF